MLAVWVAGGVFALCGALSMAEIASALPRTGGIYVFVREGWGRMTAFLFGWAQLLIIRAAALGAISITFAEYAFRVAGLDPSLPDRLIPVRLTAAAAIAVTGLFNVVGVRWGALVTNVTTLAKYGGLVFIVLVAFLLGLPQTGGHFTPAFPPGSFSIGAAGLALVSTLWAYDGWADLSFAAGEVRDPQKNLPRALIGGTLLVIAIYLLANLAYLAVLPIEEIRRSPLVAAEVAQRLLGDPGVVFVAVTVTFSTFGVLNSTLFTAPRVIFAMADDGLFLRGVAAVHPRFETPWVSVLLCAALGIAFVLLRSFEQLADQFVTALLPFYGLAVAAIFRLRRDPAYRPAFRVPLYPVVPLVFLASVIFLLGNALVDAGSRLPTLIILGVILAGIPVYRVVAAR